MSWKPSNQLKFILVASLLVTGCFPTQPMYLRDKGGGDLSYYLDQATRVDYPDVTTSRLEEVSQTKPPITVVDPDFQSFYDLTLEECVSMALQNSKIIRGYGTPSLQGTRVSPGLDNLTTGVGGVGSLYNVAVRETEPGFIGTPGQFQNPGFLNTNTGLDSNQGVEAALADFDAQYSANAFWGRSDEPRNNTRIQNINPAVFQQDQLTLQHEIAKKTAEGTQLFLRNSNIYTSNNVPLSFQLFPTWWRSAIELEVRQPLLRGRGAFINRMPIMISRIGTDQEIANLEAQLQNMVTNVEIRYWDLNLAYRNLEAAKTGRDAALETWRIVKDQFDEGANVNIQQVSQSKEQYHFFDEQVIEAYNNLLVAESDLRYLLGIAQTDGQIIRPIDEPVMAPIEFDWCSSMEEALDFRPELRQERWEIKKKELSLAYAKNSLLPVLNVTGLYRWLGLGDRLVNYNDGAPNFTDPTPPLPVGSGAFNDLWESRFQEFQLGLEYRVPVGLRREMANVMNAQVKLAREQARLEDMELDVTRELSSTVRALAANRKVMQSAFNRWTATKVEIDHFKRLATEGVETLDVALDAQRRVAQAEQAFYSALCEYNKTIALMHRRKGTILAYNGVSFGEGPWPGKAYQDAQEQARQRSAARPLDYGWTRPEVISRGPGGPIANQDCADGGCINVTEDTLIEPDFETVFPEGDVIQSPYYESPNLNVSPETVIPAQPKIRTQSFQNVPLGKNVMRDDNVAMASYSAGQIARDAATDYLNAVGVSPVNQTPPKADKLTAPAKPTDKTISVDNFDWNRFGLTRPDQSDGTVNAKIKINSNE